MGGFWAGIGFGTALFWVLVSIFVLLVCAAVVFAARYRRIKRLLQPVVYAQLDPGPSDPQQEDFTQTLTDAGYAYDPEQNIYYSIREPWQRDMGYCRLYDDLATPLGMVFDSEPIRFSYRGKRWLIEFWKGQYGITVGGEIGVYNTTEPDLEIPGVFSGPFYTSAGDDEALELEFTLRRNKKVLFTRADRHWWLTGFVLGQFADPSSLAMDVSITLLDSEMRDLFMIGLYNLGYTEDEFDWSGNTVRFTFAKPRSSQPQMRQGLISAITMRRNRAFVADFQELTEGLTDPNDILRELKAKSPLLYHLALDIGKQAELFKQHEEIRKRLAQPE